MAQPGMRVSEVPGMPGWYEGLHLGLCFFSSLLFSLP